MPRVLYRRDRRRVVEQTGVVPALRPFVVVSGPPASGKSTLAPLLAQQLELPLLAKDTIKDALITALGADDVEASRRLGRASVAVLYALAAASPVGAVLETVLFRSVASAELRRLPGTVIEVFCCCDRDTALRRYRQRAGTRHAGHFDAQRTVEELWNTDNAEPVAGGWPVLEVDTTRTVGLDRLVNRIRATLGLSDTNGT